MNYKMYKRATAALPFSQRSLLNRLQPTPGQTKVKSDTEVDIGVRDMIRATIYNKDKPKGYDNYMKYVYGPAMEARKRYKGTDFSFADNPDFIRLKYDADIAPDFRSASERLKASGHPTLAKIVGPAGDIFMPGLLGGRRTRMMVPVGSQAMANMIKSDTGGKTYANVLAAGSLNSMDLRKEPEAGADADKVHAFTVLNSALHHDLYHPLNAPARFSSTLNAFLHGGNNGPTMFPLLSDAPAVIGGRGAVLGEWERGDINQDHLDSTIYSGIDAEGYNTLGRAKQLLATAGIRPRNGKSYTYDEFMDHWRNNRKALQRSYLWDTFETPIFMQPSKYDPKNDYRGYMRSFNGGYIGELQQAEDAYDRLIREGRSPLAFHPFANASDMRKAKEESKRILRKVFEQAL